MHVISTNYIITRWRCDSWWLWSNGPARAAILRKAIRTGSAYDDGLPLIGVSRGGPGGRVKVGPCGYKGRAGHAASVQLLATSLQQQQDSWYQLSKLRTPSSHWENEAHGNIRAIYFVRVRSFYVSEGCVMTQRGQHSREKRCSLMKRSFQNFNMRCIRSDCFCFGSEIFLKMHRKRIIRKKLSFWVIFQTLSPSSSVKVRGFGFLFSIPQLCLWDLYEQHFWFELQSLSYLMFFFIRLPNFLFKKMRIIKNEVNIQKYCSC